MTLYGTDVHMVTANMAGMYDCLVWNRCMVTANMAHMYDPLVVSLHSLRTRKW